NFDSVGSVGAPELIVIFLVALIVLGPDKLPSAARQAGKFIGDLRRMMAGFEAEVKSAMRDEPITNALREGVASARGTFTAAAQGSEAGDPPSQPTPPQPPPSLPVPEDPSRN